MNWFKHDSDATQDAKIKKLLIHHGAIGYAVYFHCIELIAGDVTETNMTFELEHDSEIIADNLRIRGDTNKSGSEIVEEIMRFIIGLGLFAESNGHIYCFKLLKRLDQSMSSSVRFRKMIADAKQNHDGVMIPSCKIRLDEIREDKNREEENTVPPSAIATGHASVEAHSSKPIEKKEPPQYAIDLALLLYTLHRDKWDSGYNVTTSQLHAWARDIEKLNRLDGRSVTEIEMVIRWVQNMEPKNGFTWANNILSGAKLRAQFPTLLAQSKTVSRAPLPMDRRTEFLDLPEAD